MINRLKIILIACFVGFLLASGVSYAATGTIFTFLIGANNGYIYKLNKSWQVLLQNSDLKATSTEALLEVQASSTPGIYVNNGIHSSSTSQFDNLIAWETATSTGKVSIATTTDSDHGVVRVENERFIHNYGTENMFIGKGAGNFTLTVANAQYNTGLGKDSLNKLTTGAKNTAVGYHTGYKMTQGQNNSIFGYLAGEDLTIFPNNNSLFGAWAGSNLTTGSDNTAFGHFSLYDQITATSSTAIGSNALGDNSTGEANTALGYYAGVNDKISAFRNTTGRRNLFLGWNASPESGALENAIAIGASSTIAVSNGMALGGTGNMAVSVGIATSTPGGTYGERLTVVGDSYTTETGIFGSLRTTDGTLSGNQLADIYGNLPVLNSISADSGQIFEASARIGANFQTSATANKSAAGLFVDVKTDAGAGDYYFADGILIDTIVKSGSGTITSIAGIYVEPQTAADYDYSLVTNAGYVYHGSKVKINSTAAFFDPADIPTVALDVVGDVLIAGNATTTGSSYTAGQVWGGFNSQFGSSAVKWQIEDLDLSGLGYGHYPTLTPYSDGALGNVGAIRNGLYIIDKPTVTSRNPQLIFMEEDTYSSATIYWDGTAINTSQPLNVNGDINNGLGNITSSGVITGGTLTDGYSTFNLGNATTTGYSTIGSFPAGGLYEAGVLNLGATATSSVMAGSLIVDTTTLVVNANENRVGIGTASPGYQLEITVDGANAARGLNIGEHRTGAAASVMYFERSRGTKASPTTVAINDAVGEIYSRVYDGDEYLLTSAMGTIVGGTVANNSVPTDFVWANSQTGAADLISSVGEKMRLNYFGALGLGTTTPKAVFTVATSTNNAGVAFENLLQVATSSNQGIFIIDKNGKVKVGQGGAWTNYAVCYLAGGELGHCSDTVGAGGTCSCVSN